MTRTFIILGALLAFVGVALGAFAAHVLKNKIAPDLFAVFEVGVRYHMYHALGLLAVAWLSAQFPNFPVAPAGWLFVAGIVLFSGSLYAMSFTGIKELGMITPVGGLCFLAGWCWIACIAWTAWKAV